MKLFNLFRKQENTKTENEEIEYIEINDEKSGEPTKVEKSKWLENFNKLVKENEDNPSELYNIILSAFDYGIYKETLDACMRCYMIDDNIERRTNLLCTYYTHNRLYKDAINLYEKYMEDGNKMTSNMYYNLALLQEKVKDLSGMEKNLFYAFSIKPNFKKAINKYIEYLKSENPENYYTYLEDLAIEINSWYLKKEVAKILYNLKQKELATKYLIEALADSGFREEVFLETAKILKDNKKMTEFENQILTRYDVRNASIELHLVVLDFYLQDKQYIKGLKLLNELFSLNIYDHKFISFEKNYLLLKLENEKKEHYTAYVNNKGIGNNRIKLLDKSIEYFAFNKEPEKREGIQILILPFVLDKKVNNISKTAKIFTKTISTYLFETLYNISNIDVKSLLVYDDLGTIQYIRDYPVEYFNEIKNKNQNLDYIISGVVHDFKEDGSFSLSVYEYDLNNKQKTNIFETNVSREMHNNILNKLINNCLKDTFKIDIPFISIEEKNILTYYNEIMDLVLNVHGYNKYKVFTTKYIIDYLFKEIYSKNQVKLHMNLLLSIISMQKDSIVKIKESYKNMVYASIIKNNFNEDIIRKFEMIYGANDE